MLERADSYVYYRDEVPESKRKFKMDRAGNERADLCVGLSHGTQDGMQSGDRRFTGDYRDPGDHYNFAHNNLQYAGDHLSKAYS